MATQESLDQTTEKKVGAGFRKGKQNVIDVMLRLKEHGANIKSGMEM